ncbi:chemotaxis protein [Rhodoplanes elegans]|uniref:Chemotaxis protein n=1 Tax=Rhodoplanes elegans TaxID=29408 RepID=A0A327KH78_9BRAD|nr:DUF6468 domain-containing protein [Rhodoplanes elegans]MBK5962431.1 chemotaxis protein [Rhodoplanes elegans]RAI34628.1 chemotaxis protein [Rhodoplanes elegans]
MTHWIGFAVEGLVSVLLLLTVIYCTMLNKQLRRLKADEHALKATIAELITATEIAERAIAGLKVTVRDVDQNIGDRLRTAERFAADISRQIEAGNLVLDRLTKVVLAGRPLTDPEGAAEAAEQAAAGPVPADSKAVAAAAQAFAQRTRARARGLAA